MIRALRMALPGVLALAFVAGAAAPPARPAPKVPIRHPDQLDYLFLASDRPVLIRMHVRIGDKPYTAAWEVFLNKLFTWFDKNKDGVLDAKEVARIIPANFLQNQVQGSIGGPSGQTVQMSSVDTDKNGKVTRQEFRDYYAKNGFAALRFYNQNNEAQTARATNDAIYRLLGHQPSAELKKEDAERLPAMMLRLDENEDEYLTASELNTDGDNNNGYGFVQPPRRMRGQPQQQLESGLLEITPAMTPASLAQQLLGRYDKNRDGKLTPGEGGLDRALFAELDRNGDGKLDTKELEGFFRREPDLVFLARVGQVGGLVGNALNNLGLRLGQKGRTEVYNPTRRAMPMGKKVRTVDPDTLGFELGDSRFSLQANQGNFGRFNGAKEFYLQQFDALKDKNGIVHRKQEKENQGNPFVFQIFAQADKNADDKLERKELVEWLDLMGDGNGCFVTIQVNDVGRSLFNLMDLNADGQLSTRELRGAWEKMQPLCRPGKGLTQADLPRTLRISLGQGNAFFRAVPVLAAGGRMGRVGRGRVATNVPVWFRKMDLNGDGDVSPREWLGTEEEFRKIDTDGDGLISAEEARQHEARQKKTKPAVQPQPTAPPTPAK